MPIKVIKIKPEFSDDRGYLSRVLDERGLAIKSIIYIKRKAGIISANHYHKKDTHYILCVSGKIKYSEKNVNKKKSRISSVIIHPNEMVKSAPYSAHSTEFLEDTTALAFSTQHRDQKQYESDTIRINDFDQNR
jgi:dTDP-4-dehydrorhamnose 3,5-epimerase-like enzyme